MPLSRTGKAVVLLSGGIDSSTTLAVAHKDGHEIYAMTFDYHQRHARELSSAHLVAEALGVAKHLVVRFDLRDIGGSALTAEIEVPKSGQTTTFKRPGTAGLQDPAPGRSLIPVTYVPARNTIFLSFALGWAEVLEAENIYIGATAVDYSGYPDCRPAYLNAFEQMANLATRASVEGKLHFRIRAPLVSLSKAEIIRTGLDHGLDYSLTWSCYDPQPLRRAGGAGRQLGQEPADDSQFIPCRRCDSCLLREKGFREAGIADPLIEKVAENQIEEGHDDREALA